jgi:branched-chain amino acid transport system substrate-binding protein
MKRASLFLAAVVLVMAGVTASWAADPGVTPTTVRFGVIVDKTGPVAFLGQSMEKGTRAYINHINAQGGVHGRKIELLVETDDYTPAKTVAAAKKLVDRDEVFGFVANLGSAPTLAILDFIQERKIPLVGPASGAPAVFYPPKRYVFGSIGSFIGTGRIIADYAATEMGRSKPKIGIMYHDDEFGQGILNNLRAQLKDKHALDLAGEASVKRGAVDVSAQVLRLREAGSEIVVLAAPYGPAANFLKEAAKLAWKPTFILEQTAVDPKVVELAGPAAEGALITAKFEFTDSQTPAVLQAKKLVEQSYPGTALNNFVYWGYVPAVVLVEGLRRAGKDLTREGLTAALEGLKGFETGITPPINYSPESRVGHEGMFFGQIKDGKFVRTTPWKTFRQ